MREDVPLGDFADLSSAMSPDPGTPPGMKTPPEQKPAMVAVTPPQATKTGRARSDPRSGDPLSPGSNCNTEELRIFAQKKFNYLEAMLQNVTNVQLKQQAAVDGVIRALQDNEKNFKEKDRDTIIRAGQLSQEAVDTAMKIGRDAAGNEHALRGQLSEFAGRLDAHTADLAKFEAQYNNHIENNFNVMEANFNVVEKEFGDLRQAFSCAAAAPSAGTPGITPTLNAF